VPSQLAANLDNPDFGKVARATSLWGRTVTDRAELETAGGEWLAEACGRRNRIWCMGPSLFEADWVQLILYPAREYRHPLCSASRIATEW
jgi:hypothetical protein